MAIEYNYLGSTGIEVSRVALGCGFRGIREKKDAVETISKAMDTGINFIDCANVYRLRNGIHAEEALGEALQGKRSQFIITSKFGNPFNEAKREANDCGGATGNMIKFLEDSLKRLHTDYIDVYLLHLPDDHTSYESLVLGLDSLIRAGKIRYAGLCNHKAWQIAAINEISKRLNIHNISVIQNPYNLLNRSPEDELIPMLEYEELGFMVYSPLAAGLLCGDFAKGNTPPEKSTWSYNEHYAEYLKYVFPGRIEEIVNAVDDVAKKYNTSSATVSAAWVLRNKSVSSIVSGADSIDEFMDAIRAFELVIDEKDWEYLDELSVGMAEFFIHFTVEEKVERIKKMGGYNNGKID